MRYTKNKITNQCNVLVNVRTVDQCMHGPIHAWRYYSLIIFLQDRLVIGVKNPTFGRWLDVVAVYK